jgi:hypothetical protein
LPSYQIEYAKKWEKFQMEVITNAPKNAETIFNEKN